MRTYYNRIAGQNIGRLAALSDGIFAVAMTLLVLGLSVPTSTELHTSHALFGNALLGALLHLVPSFVTYIMSFLTLGIFWIGQQTQLNNLEHSDHRLTWLNLAFLLAVTLTPFSTALLSSYITMKTALVLYWFNILLLGILLFTTLMHAKYAGLIREDVTEEAFAVIRRRIVVAQALYGFGALLCVINTYVSITVIVLVQLNYAIAPPNRFLNSL